MGGAGGGAFQTQGYTRVDDMNPAFKYPWQGIYTLIPIASGP